MSINERSYSLITKALDQYTCYEYLTIQELADKSNTSTATIQRFCKREGYPTFNAFKENLIYQSKNNIRQSLIRIIDNNIDDEIIDKLADIDLTNYDMIFLYTKMEYSSIAKQYAFLLNQLKIKVNIVYDSSDLEKEIQNPLLISIGPLPSEFYNKQYEYLEICFDVDEVENPINVYQINLQAPIYNNYSVRNLNFRIYSINLIMFTLIENTTIKLGRKCG